MKPHLVLSVAVLSLGISLAPSLSAAPPAPAGGSQSTSALINQQLDKLIQLQLSNSALPQVLKSIEEKTGVPVRVTADVYDLLPYGTQTPVTATIENVPLRDALIALCGKLGLRVDLRDEFVELSPEPALRRVGRRATLQELRTLDLLGARKLDLSRGDALAVVPLTQAIDASLGAFDVDQRKVGKPAAGIVLELRSAEGVDATQTTVRLQRDSTLRAALDAIADQTKLTWYPWGDSVVVLPKRSVIRAQLDRPVALRYEGVDVAQVFADLAKQTGVDFLIEPGAIQRVPPEFRIVKLVADAPVRQSLESLQGYTGLGYVVTDEGVYVWNQNSSPTSARGKVAALLEVAPFTQVIVYEEDLSPAARDALRAQRREAIASFERSLAKPTTQAAEH